MYKNVFNTFKYFGLRIYKRFTFSNNISFKNEGPSKSQNLFKINFWLNIIYLINKNKVEKWITYWLLNIIYNIIF